MKFASLKRFQISRSGGGMVTLLGDHEAVRKTWSRKSVTMPPGFGRRHTISENAAALAAVGLVVLAAAVTPAGAGSIWARANANPDVPARVYEDDVARRVGDILTILIDERSNIDNETERKNDRSGSGAISGSGSVALNSLGSTKPFTLPNVDVTAQASNTFDGKADLKSQRTQSDRITVTVHDVLPNGNLVILGSRQRNVHGDTQTISISGIVRPSDITYSNTINSEQVADFRLVTLIKGPENDVAQPGLIGWIMNWVRLMTW